MSHRQEKRKRILERNRIARELAERPWKLLWEEILEMTDVSLRRAQDVPRGGNDAW